MAENCDFEGAFIQNLVYCPNDPVVGGVAVDFYYSPAANFATFQTPVATGETSYAERLAIPANGLTFKPDKGWKKITMMIDENELKNTFVGNRGNKKPKVEFDAYIPNFIPRNIGFLDAHINTPMVWAVPDSTGKVWIVGTPKAPAMFDKGDGTTGKKYEDNSGAGVTVNANTKILTYAGEVVELADA